MTARLGRAEIAALIPHAGPMCLLDSVRCWDSAKIVCTAVSHRDRDNPLADNGRLDVMAGIEYAAQAMAVHGGLTSAAGNRPAAGYLASVRDVTCHHSRLDSLPEDLEVTAVRLAADAAGAVYQFVLRCGDATLLQGRAAVVLDVDVPTSAA